MKKNLTWKAVLILLVIALSVFMFYPPRDKIVLGLDLRGGMHLILEVQTDEAIRVQTDQNVAQLKQILADSGIVVEDVQRKGVNGIELRGELGAEERRIRDILDDDFQDWTYTFGAATVSLTLRPNIERRLRELSVDQALETIRNRVDEFGVAEPVIQKEGFSGERLLVQLPGVDDPQRVKELIRSTAMLEFKQVMDGPFPSEEDALAKYGGVLPGDLEMVRANPRRLDRGVYVLRSAPIVTGKDLKNARRSQDEYGGPAVGFSFNSQGAAKFERFTAANIGKMLSIVLDERVESVATVQAVISYDGIIQGRFTVEEVDDIVLVLRSGALPAPMKYLEERTVGPSLGADSIRKGLVAALIGFMLIIAFMFFYYRLAGINSILALILNLVILLGVMAYLKATLTLPGIAGVILTIGMAVDANVLIFERIKEELRSGKTPKSAIDAGFKKAFSTIFDANITTIIAAVFLFQFGTGPIKGFSVTLIIGILASMFTAIFVSRFIFELIYGRKSKVTRMSI